MRIRLHNFHAARPSLEQMGLAMPGVDPFLNQLVINTAGLVKQLQSNLELNTAFEERCGKSALSQDQKEIMVETYSGTLHVHR